MLPIFVTLDPRRDSCAQVGAYVRDFHPRMLGLTGTPGQVAHIAKQFRVFFQVELWEFRVFFQVVLWEVRVFFQVVLWEVRVFFQVVLWEFRVFFQVELWVVYQSREGLLMLDVASN